MPRCTACSKPFRCTCDASQPAKLGATDKSCPLVKKPGAVWVHVTDDKGVDVKGASPSNDGGAKTTGPDGLAIFDPVPAGPHSVDLAALSTEVAKLYQKPTDLPPRQVQARPPPPPRRSRSRAHAPWLDCTPR